MTNKISGPAAIKAAYREAFAATKKQNVPESQRDMVAFMAVRDHAADDTETLHALLRLSQLIKERRMTLEALEAESPDGFVNP